MSTFYMHWICVRTSAREILQAEMKSGQYESSTLLYILLETVILFFVILKMYFETLFCFIYTFYSFSEWHNVVFHCLATLSICPPFFFHEDIFFHINTSCLTLTCLRRGLSVWVFSEWKNVGRSIKTSNILYCPKEF